MKKKIKKNLPLFLSSVQAGFPSPADDFIDKTLDLNTYLIANPTSTFFVKVQGKSMINAGIEPGDILVVDKSLHPKNNEIILAIVDSEFTVKRFVNNGNQITLQPENTNFDPIVIKDSDDFEIWGVVSSVIKKFR